MATLPVKLLNLFIEIFGVSDSFILKILVKIEEGFSFGREGLCYERKVVTGGVMNWMTG